MSVVDIQYASPGDCLRVDIQPSEFADLLLSQIIWVGLIDPQFLEAAEHDWSKFALALLCRHKSLVERPILLCVLMEDAGLDSSGKQVICRGDGVDVACKMKIELIHGNDLAVASSSG